MAFAAEPDIEIVPGGEKLLENNFKSYHENIYERKYGNNKHIKPAGKKTESGGDEYEKRK